METFIFIICSYLLSLTTSTTTIDNQWIGSVNTWTYNMNAHSTTFLSTTYAFKEYHGPMHGGDAYNDISEFYQSFQCKYDSIMPIKYAIGACETASNDFIISYINNTQIYSTSGSATWTGIAFTDPILESATTPSCDHYTYIKQGPYRLSRSANIPFEIKFAVNINNMHHAERNIVIMNVTIHCDAQPLVSTPSQTPTINPSISPTSNPSNTPSSNPTKSPNIIPSDSPTLNPSNFPTSVPSDSSVSNPTYSPTIITSDLQTQNPSMRSSFQIISSLNENEGGVGNDVYTTEYGSNEQEVLKNTASSNGTLIIIVICLFLVIVCIVIVCIAMKFVLYKRGKKHVNGINKIFTDQIETNKIKGVISTSMDDGDETDDDTLSTNELEENITKGGGNDNKSQETNDIFVNRNQFGEGYHDEDEDIIEMVDMITKGENNDMNQMNNAINDNVVLTTTKGSSNIQDDEFVIQNDDEEYVTTKGNEYENYDITI